MQHLRIGMSGEGVEVGYEEATVIILLHSHEFAQRSVIVAEVEVAGGTDAAQHYLFLFVLVGLLVVFHI